MGWRAAALATAAAALLGIPTVDPGAPALVLQQAERLLDDADVHRPFRLDA